MATVAFAARSGNRANRFYAYMALAMLLLVLAGFSGNWLRGFSTFAAPPLIHFHAIVFMGWIVLFTTQAWLAYKGPPGAHRLLGRLLAGWLVLMVVSGLWVLAFMAQNGRTPFFFQPQLLLVADSVNMIGSIAVVLAALALRGKPEWHMRLQLCATSSLIAPGIGRLLPMPFMIPWSWQIALVVTAIFPLIGMARDKRVIGRVHPAWYWGLASVIVQLALVQLITFSPLGNAIYAWVVAGSPGEAISGLAFPPPPPM
jgi:NADH:ubiquinone oxidoreductase subunit 6 (subunit J)